MQTHISEPDNNFRLVRPRRNRDGGISVYVGCDVPIEIMKRAQEQARIEERTVAAIIRRALAAYLSRNSEAA
jgi:hypothetical protein